MKPHETNVCGHREDYGRGFKIVAKSAAVLSARFVVLGDMNRRSLILGGVASLIAAPAVVRAGSLMPVRLPNLFFERGLWAYHILTDEMILRVDRARHKLKSPKEYRDCLYVVPMKNVERFFPRQMRDDLLCPHGQQQQNIERIVTLSEMHSAGFYPETSLTGHIAP